jgi:hypothetical protein
MTIATTLDDTATAGKGLQSLVAQAKKAHMIAAANKSEIPKM